jgi:hypothetical protein
VAKPAFIGPLTASDGIHDREVTLDSTRMPQTLSAMLRQITGGNLNLVV